MRIDYLSGFIVTYNLYKIIEKNYNNLVGSIKFHMDYKLRYM